MASQRAAMPPERHGHRWPWIAGILGAIILVAVLFVAFVDPFTDEDQEEVTSYTEAIVGASLHVNPLLVYQSDADRDLSELVFSGLTRLSNDGTPEPSLAESWDISNDNTTYTFHLRQGVTWHNGEEFTAEDVAFTYGVLADPALQGDPDQAALWQSVDCSATEPLTIVCELPEPYSPFLSYTTVGILPEHILGQVAPQDIVEDAFNRAPVGTGPYRLTSINETRAVLEANADFYLGAPGIERIELRFYPDVSSAAADVVRGEAEGLLVDLTINPQDYGALQAATSLTPHLASRAAYTSLYLNNREVPLNDMFVRQAIVYAVDVDEIIASLLGGRAVHADTPIPPGTWAYDPDAQAPARNLTLAENLLDVGGWELADGETVRSRNDVELRFSLMTDQDPLRGAIADAIAAQLAEVGIEATVVREASGSLVSDFLIPKQYQAAVFGWDPGADPDPYPAWHSSQASGQGRNLAAYTNEAADELMESARQTTDMEERIDYYSRFQQIFIEDVPSVPIYYPIYTYFVSSRVGEADPGVLFWPASRFANVQEWTVQGQPALGQ
jgi:peptide/nickel transport system substrate-binding protein